MCYVEGGGQTWRPPFILHVMANIFQRAAKLFRARVGPDDYASVLAHSGLYAPTKAGVSITDKTAMSIAAVYACVNKIASTLAQLNLDLIRMDGRSRERVRNHYGYYVTQVRPNRYCTPYEFWETIIAHAVLRGAGHALIERGASGEAVSMTILHPDDVERREKDGSYVYRIRNEFTAQPDDVLEIFNLHRASPIAVHRENIGLSKAVQDYGAEYFGNGGQMTGVLSSDQPLKSEQMQIIQQSWNKSATTSGTKLLPFGFRYNRIGITPDEAQFINTRRLQAEEICRIFSVPPSLIQLDTQSTFNNVEQQTLQFTRHTLTPWARRIEQELNRKLLTTFDQADMEFSFRMADLHRGDMAGRAAFYQQGIQHGWLSVNEVRGMENLNPTTGGDQHMCPVNMVALDQFGEYSNQLTNQNNGTEQTE